MGLFGIAGLWLGYSVFYYGYNRITGGNDKFISLIWPGRYTPTARDDGSGGAGSTATALSKTTATAAGKAAAGLDLQNTPIPPTNPVTVGSGNKAS